MTIALACPLLPILHFGQSLQPPERFKHRAWIGVRVEALLDGYWTARPSDPVREQIMLDWIDVLDQFTRDEITRACRQWVSDNPRRKPNFGDIRQVILQERAEVRAKNRAPEPEPDSALTVSSEERRRQADAIMVEVFGRRRMVDAR